jgi:hypothetical protein
VDDRDLQLLRGLGLDEARPNPNLQGRIEEQLWQAILAEEAAMVGRGRGRRSWRTTLLRPLAAAAAAATMAVGVAIVSDGGPGVAGPGGAAVTQAGSNVLDRTANAIFGGPSSATAAPIVGMIDLRSTDTGDLLARGPVHTRPGVLDERTAQLVRMLTRDPSQLHRMVRSGVESLEIDIGDDHLTYRATMRWIVDPAVPVDLRAALLRSLSGLQYMDEARTGVDVLGRSGIVLGHLDRDSGVRTQAVLDPDGGTLREVRSFTTTYVDPACEPGTFTEHLVYADDGSWIDPSALPWVAWPQVIAACGDLTA